MKALSSSDDRSRLVAYATLSEVYDLNLTQKEWSYHHELALLLETLLNAVDSPNKRFPNLIGHFLTCVVSILTKPRHIVFNPLVTFIASAPALRLTNVPMFSELFGQDGIEYRAQRSYVLKMLQNGIAEPADVQLLKRGKVLERLMSYFSSPLTDLRTRESVLAILLLAGRLERLEETVLWVFSVLTETFSAPHVDALVNLALGTKDQTSAEKDCCVFIAREAWINHRSHLQKQTADAVQTVLCQSDIPV
jgi:hypothetical protein